MSTDPKLNLDDLDARAHDLDDAKADEISGGFFKGHAKAKKTSGAPKTSQPKPSFGGGMVKPTPAASGSSKTQGKTGGSTMGSKPHAKTASKSSSSSSRGAKAVKKTR